MTVVLVFLILLFVPHAASAGCADNPTPCLLRDGEFHIALPDSEHGAPVVIFLHGAGSSGANVMRNSRLISSFTDRGYAVIAPSALPRRPGASGGVWNFYPGWEGRDEPAFLQAALKQASMSFGIDADRVLLTGFSAGAFMVSYLACQTPNAFSAYAPLAGTFWEPMPDECKGPVNLFQTHGWRDPTVPLEGRPLNSMSHTQGDVFIGLRVWRRANECIKMSPQRFAEQGNFLRRSWTDCTRGGSLEFALHPGGHSIPAGWADMILDWFEETVH